MATWYEKMVDRGRDLEITSVQGDLAVIQTKWYTNKGKDNEVSGYAEADIATTLESAVELYGEEQLLRYAAKAVLTKAATKARFDATTPEKTQKKAAKVATNLQQLADELGVTVQDLIHS